MVDTFLSKVLQHIKVCSHRSMPKSKEDKIQQDRLRCMKNIEHDSKYYRRDVTTRDLLWDRKQIHRHNTQNRKETGKQKLPVQNRREEFFDEALVVWSQHVHVDGFIAFAIKIVRVEGLDGLKDAEVFFVSKVRVSTFPVPRIEAVVADHG